MSPVAAAALAAGTMAVTGCSSSTDIGANAPAQLSFIASSAAASNASAALAPITNGGHTLDLTQVTLTIARAELKRTSTDACRGDDDGANNDQGNDGNDGGMTATMEDCAEVKVGPTTVDLPLDGGMVTLPADAIPAGTFHQLELRVSSVRLVGTFDAKAFDVTLPVDVHGEIEFATPLVVTDGTPTAITVTVPAGGWLVNPDGTLIDPNTILTTPSVLSTVKSRIAASLRAFEDENHDGRDDHDHGHDG